MKQSLEILIFLAILSNVLCLDIGRFFGLRRNLQDDSTERSIDPKIVEVVRWRQPVCVVPASNVSPCFVQLRKYQNDYERISARKIDESNSNESKYTEGMEKEIDNKKKRRSLIDETNNGRFHLDKIPKILTPQIADYLHVDNFASDLESSETTSIDHHLTVRSSTPGIENARAHRDGRYLIISTMLGKSVTPSSTPPAISVTKVLNSPVTATLVANICFPDIGVPLCDEYQETIRIYKEPAMEIMADKKHDNQEAQFSDEIHNVNETLKNHQEEFSSSSESSPLDRDYESDYTTEAYKPKGLLAKVVQHVINKPGVVDRMPKDVFKVIANNPGIIEAVLNATFSRDTSSLTANAESIELATTTSKPGFIQSLFNIPKPSIFNPFGFIFNKGTTAKPTLKETEATESLYDRQTNGQNIIEKTIARDSEEINHKPEVTGQSSIHEIKEEPIVQMSDEIIKKPSVLGIVEEPVLKPIIVLKPTKNPGLLENVWPTGKLGILVTLSPHELLSTTGKPAVSLNQEKTVGGYISNPSRSTSVDKSLANTKQILGPANPIFSLPPKKPLIIERPGEKPLLVEEPIYLNEMPVRTERLINFYVPLDGKSDLNVEYDIIKEPVYVYENPQTLTGIMSYVFGSTKPFRFFQGWAIFGKHENKESSSNYGESATSVKPEETVTTEKMKIDEISKSVMNDSVKKYIRNEDINAEEIKPKKPVETDEISREVDNVEEENAPETELPEKTSIPIDDNSGSPVEKSVVPIEDISAKIAKSRLESPVSMTIIETTSRTIAAEPIVDNKAS